MDIIWGFGSQDPGSNPGALSNSKYEKEQRKKEGNEMKMEEIENRKRDFNGVGDFWQHPHKENWYYYAGRNPTSDCIVIIAGEEVEVHNFVVDEEDRGKGNGTAMIADIRQAFPDKHIWVDTCTHARPFWQKMIEYGYINSIENDYDWPCIDTTCTVCHPERTEGRRRGR